MKGQGVGQPSKRQGGTLDDGNKPKRSYLYVKRGFDFVASSIGLILLLPILVIIAIMIKLEDPRGPILFSQIRIGKNGTRFRMYKFRSMCVDAEAKLAELRNQNEIEGAMFKIKNDPRITKVGHFIRKTSLDELPQLWNVIRGEMSLVGPRPCLVEEYEEYTDYDKRRLVVKPGCTGLWQVSGRNNVGFREMVEMDLRYIKKRNFFIDITILLKTILIIVHPNTAY